MTSGTVSHTAPPGVLMPSSSTATSPPRQVPPDGAGSEPVAPLPRPRRLATPLRPRDFGSRDILLLAVSALSSFCLTWIIFFQVTSWSGALGFLVCWYIGFLTLTWLSTAQVVERSVATDRVVAVLVVSAATLVTGLVVFIVAWVAYKAVPTIHWGSLFTHDQAHLLVTDPKVLDHVGVLHAVMGTVEQVLLAALMGVPFAIATAVFLSEVKGWGVRIVRTVVTAMSGTPSVVAGIFIYSMLILTGVLKFSGFAASLALVVILLPSVTRVVEEVLRVVPSGLREASQALGAPEWRTVWSVVLPTARSGVVTAVLLGVARIVGETAPLLFTAFGSQVKNPNPFSGDQGALPISIWSDVKFPNAVYQELAFQAAFVLISIVLVLFVLARLFSRPKGKRSKRVQEQVDDDLMARFFLPVPIERPNESEVGP